MGNSNKRHSISSKEINELVSSYNKENKIEFGFMKERKKISSFNTKSLITKIIKDSGNAPVSYIKKTETLPSISKSSQNKFTEYNKKSELVKFLIEVIFKLISPNNQRRMNEINIHFYFPLFLISNDEPSVAIKFDYNKLTIDNDCSENVFINLYQMIKTEKLLSHKKIVNFEIDKRGGLYLIISEFLKNNVNNNFRSSDNFAFSPINLCYGSEPKNSREQTISKIDLTVAPNETDREDPLGIEDEFNFSNFMKKETERVVKERGKPEKEKQQNVVNTYNAFNNFNVNAKKNNLKIPKGSIQTNNNKKPVRVFNGNTIQPSYQKSQIKLYQNNKLAKNNNLKPTFYKILEYDKYVNQRNNHKNFKTFTNYSNNSKKPLSSSNSKVFNTIVNNEIIRKNSVPKQKIIKSNPRSKSENFKIPNNKVNGQMIYRKTKNNNISQPHIKVFKKSKSTSLNEQKGTSDKSLAKIKSFKLDIKDLLMEEDDETDNFKDNKIQNIVSIPEVEHSENVTKLSDNIIDLKNKLSFKASLTKKKQFDVDDIIIKDDVFKN